MNIQYYSPKVFGLFSSIGEGFSELINDFNNAITKIENFFTKTASFFETLAWIIVNPFKSALYLSTLVLKVSSTTLLVLCIITIITRMFTGENEYIKIRRFFRSAMVLSFVLCMVLRMFLNVGYA